MKYKTVNYDAISETTNKKIGIYIEGNTLDEVKTKVIRALKNLYDAYSPGHLKRAVKVIVEVDDTLELDEYGIFIKKYIEININEIKTDYSISSNNRWNSLNGDKDPEVSRCDNDGGNTEYIDWWK